MVSRKGRFRKSRKSAFQSIVARLVFLVLLGGGIGFLAIQNVKINQTRVELRDKLQTLQAEASELASKKGELEKRLQTVGSEEHIEKILREQGLYQKPGEEVITVLPPENQEVHQKEGQQQSPQKRSWWNPWTW